MKRLQLSVTDEAWNTIDLLIKEANENFELGSISLSDVVNEMALCAKVDVKVLQSKHTNVRKVLKSIITQKDLDADDVIKTMMEIKAKCRKSKPTVSSQEVKNV